MNFLMTILVMMMIRGTVFNEKKRTGKEENSVWNDKSKENCWCIWTY